MLFISNFWVSFSQKNFFNDSNVLFSSEDEIEGVGYDLEGIHSNNRALDAVGSDEVVASSLSCVPLVHPIIVVPQKGHPRCVLDWVAPHAELQVGDSELSDDLVHEHMVGRDVPHTSELHGSRGVGELEGFEPSADSVGQLEDSDVPDFGVALFAHFLFVVEAVSGIEARTAGADDCGLEVGALEDFFGGLDPRFEDGVDPRGDREAGAVDEVPNDAGVVGAELVDAPGIFQHQYRCFGEQREVLANPPSALDNNALVGPVEIVDEGFSARVKEDGTGIVLIAEVCWEQSVHSVGREVDSCLDSGVCQIIYRSVAES